LQNRALNGDIVGIEILPKSQWVSDYKKLPTDDYLDDNDAISNDEEDKT
jgi:hypothetical protein